MLENRASHFTGTEIQDVTRQLLEPAWLGEVVEVEGNSATLLLEAEKMTALKLSNDLCMAAIGQVGSLFKIRTGDRWMVASVRSLKLHPRDHSLVMSIVDFIGEALIDDDGVSLQGFRRGISSSPIPGSRAAAVSNADMNQIYACDKRPNITIGRVHPTRNTRATLYIDALLGKHFALVGSTGTGKSTSVSLILHRICDTAPHGHIVMIDPHGEYSAAFKQNGAIFNVDNIALPYWVMNFAEHCEIFLTSEGAERQTDMDILAKCLYRARARSKYVNEGMKLTVDTPVPYLLTDLVALINTEMGKLDKSTSSAPYMRLKTKIDEMRSDPRYSFMFSGVLVGDTMAKFLSSIFRMENDGKPISIIDVSGIPSEITSTVVAMLSRLVFDYAIWARHEQSRPILLVCEEAHRYIPNDLKTGRSAARDILGRIAKEGRKYGVSLGLITQRPSDLSEGVLSQCGTILSMRLNNDRDKAYVKAAMPEGSRGFLDSISALRNRECIVVGEGVSVPMRFAFDNLEEERRPASEDPPIADLWKQPAPSHDVLERIVSHWRHQGRRSKG